MFVLPKRAFSGTLVACVVWLAGAAPSHAGVMPITKAQAGPVLIDFGTVETFAPIDGQTINGVQFSFTVGGVHSPLAIIDSGPGNTNNITVANVVSENGSDAGTVLSLTFPTPQTRLGFGYAIDIGSTVPNAATVDLFDASNNLVGVLSATGAPDPFFTGGFLGVESNVPFVRADVSFSTAATAFAFDNVRFQFVPSDAAVPEPGTLALLGVALTGLACWRRRKAAA